MSFSTMLEILKEKNKNKIVLIKTGAFYIATGKDAVFLNNTLQLKCICFKNQICKVGIPEHSIEKYLKKLEELNVGYIAYLFESKTGEIIEQYKKDGKYHKEKNENKNCLICKGVRCYEEDKYLNAVRKLFERENNE